MTRINSKAADVFLAFDSIGSRVKHDDVGICKQYGWKSILPLSVKLLENGILQKGNIFIAAPTASGKTATAELSLYHRAVEHGVSGIYAVPYRALADERRDEIKKRFGNNVNLVIRTGDYKDLPLPTDPSKPTVLISTFEKLDILTRGDTDISSYGTIVVDEAHLVGDPSRGPRLESVVCRLREMLPNSHLIILSATIGNPEEVASWLMLEPIIGDDSDRTIRPVYKPVIESDKVEWIAGKVREEIKADGQLLVFVSRRTETEDLASRLTTITSPLLSGKDRDILEDVCENLDEVTEGGSQIDSAKSVVKYGVAFHHAGLIPEIRKTIEKGFRDGGIKVICCTTTLAAGVNLPARTVIVKDAFTFSRFKKKNTMVRKYMTPNDLLQMLGRAGRPGLETKGFGYIIFSESEWEKDTVKELWEAVEKRETLPIKSQLNRDLDALKEHIMSYIKLKGGRVGKSEIYGALAKTFWFHVERPKEDKNEDILSVLMEAFESSQRAVKEDIGSRVGNLTIVIDNIQASVPSSTSKEVYKVKMTPESYSCTCAAAKFNRKQGPCKHIVGVILCCLQSEDEDIRDLSEKIIMSLFGDEVNLIVQFNAALRRLEEKNLIKSTQTEYSLTKFGELTLRLYIRPSTASFVASRVFSGLENESRVLLGAINAASYEFGEFIDPSVALDLISSRINEEDIDNKLNIYDWSYTDLHELEDRVAWMLFSIREVSGLFAKKTTAAIADMLTDRVSLRVKPELIPIVILELPGVSVKRARHLYELGLSDVTKIAISTPEYIAKKRVISKEHATEIIKRAREVSAAMNDLKEEKTTLDQASIDTGVPVYRIRKYLLNQEL